MRYSVCSHAENDNRTSDHGSLYDACKAIVGRDGGMVLRGKALVAHWSVDVVNPGFGATEAERAQIADDADLLRVRG